METTLETASQTLAVSADWKAIRSRCRWRNHNAGVGQVETTLGAVNQTLTVSANWLDTGTATNTSVTTYPWYPGYTTWVAWPPERSRIRLALSEVERLRVIARKDKKVKAILEKFTDHIEVYVDFD